jgi:hypothetical protein
MCIFCLSYCTWSPKHTVLRWNVSSKRRWELNVGLKTEGLYLRTNLGSIQFLAAVTEAVKSLDWWSGRANDSATIPNRKPTPTADLQCRKPSAFMLLYNVYRPDNKVYFISVRAQGSFVYSQRIESYWSQIFLYLQLSTALRKINKRSIGCLYSLDTRWRTVVTSGPGRCTPENKKITGTHVVGYCVGPMEGLDILQKGKISLPYQNSIPGLSNL